MSWFNRLFRPELDIKLKQEQARLDYLRSLYEGASRKGRGQNFRTTNAGPSGESLSDFVSLRDRARYLYRNDATARRAVRVLTSYTIGTGVQAVIRDRNGDRRPELQAAFEAWARSSLCDARGRQHFYGIQRMLMRGIVLTGETLIVRRIDPALKQLGIIPLRLLVTEGDTIDHTKNDKEKFLSQGVQYTNDIPTSYWIYTKGNPADSGSVDSAAVAAEGIIHAFEEERPGQVRGISWLAPVIMRLRDVDQYADAELMRRKVAACFAAFVENTPDIKISDEEREMFSKIEPGAVEFLSPGQKVTFSNPPTQTDYEPYVKTQHQAIAMGLCVPYEHLTGNLRDVNFSSARIGQIPFRKMVEEWQYSLFIPQVMDRVWAWFVDAAILSGRRDFEGATCEWIAPRIPMLDVEKETEALRTEVRSGVLSLSEAIRESGRDPDLVLQAIAEDNARLDSLAITLDSDPRRTNQNGRLQEIPERGGEN